MFLTESLFRLCCGEIFISPQLWGNLLSSLQKRSDNCRESGAFLLGTRVARRRHVKHFVLYDDLSSGCLHPGYILFDGSAYVKLSKICAAKNMSVVADIHVHPGKAFLSQTDRDNPMMPEIGHCALIVPYYAQPPVRLEDIKIHQYLGNKRWRKMKKSTLQIRGRDK